MTSVVPKLMNLETVAELLSLSPHTIRSFVRKGKLKPVRVCRRLLFRAEDIAAFLAAADKSGNSNARPGY